MDRAHEYLCRLALQTDAAEQPVPESVEALTRRAMLFAATTTAAFLLPWIAVVHVHAAALLRAPAFASAGSFARRRGRRWGTAVAVGGGAACLVAVVAVVAGLVAAAESF